MRRRWIVAGLVLIALFATFAVLVVGRTPEALPNVIWYCAAGRELRDSPSGVTRSDLVAIPFLPRPAAVGPPTGPPMPPELIVCFAPTLATRVLASITRSPVLTFRIDGSTPAYRATGTTETADGLSWERYEFGQPPAPSPR